MAKEPKSSFVSQARGIALFTLFAPRARRKPRLHIGRTRAARGSIRRLGLGARWSADAGGDLLVEPDRRPLFERRRDAALFVGDDLEGECLAFDRGEGKIGRASCRERV